MAEANLVEIRDLIKHFPLMRRGRLFGRRAMVRAVDGVSFHIRTGETLGLVGESGCGKSTLGRLILRLIQPTSGKILFAGRDITTLSKNEIRPFRRDMQLIFQDPYGSLNPRKTAGTIIGEPLKVHGVPKQERKGRLHELMEHVGLSPQQTNRYPHEFSGGQRQRIGIARALALNPKLIVCDEPVSALDVSIQAQVINLLQDLQQEFNLTYLLISHNLSVVKHISNRVAVMYLGKLVEVAPKREIYTRPLHPYTEALMAAVPVPNPERTRERKLLEGDVPTPIDPPSGCRFRTRCKYAESLCAQKEPELADIGMGHLVSCHRIDEIHAKPSKSAEDAASVKDLRSTRAV